MKKILFLSSAMLLSMTATGMAAEKTGFYGSLKLGTSIMNADDLENTSSVANPVPVNGDSVDDTVFAGSIAAGYDWANVNKDIPVRTELEYTYRHGFSYDSNPTFVGASPAVSHTSDLNSHTFMLNAYYDIDTGTKFTPFVGAGVGFSVNKTDTTGTVISTNLSTDHSETKTDFAWSLGAGVSYALTDALSLDASYRYIDLGEADWGDSSRGVEVKSDDLTAHELYVGLRYAF